MWREQPRQIDPTGKSAKTCPAPLAKIFPFSRNPNHFTSIAIPSREEGRFGHRHERWDGMRWTRQRQACSGIAGRALPVSDQRHADDGTVAYGKTVWSWRPLLASSFAKATGTRPGSTFAANSRSDGDKNEFVSGESTV
jgi:hypothetical protein